MQFQCDQLGIDTQRGTALTELVIAQAERAKTLKEMAQNSRFFFADQLEMDEQAVKKHLNPMILEPLTDLSERLEQLHEWTVQMIHATIQSLSEQYALKLAKIAQPLRVAVTGGTISPPIDVTVYLIGQTRSVERIKQALALIRSTSS